MPADGIAADGMLLPGMGSAKPAAFRRRPALLLPLFVGSGFSALVYEIVWLQLLQLVIGSTAVSLGVLLGTFMGGMCVGSLLLPRIVSVRRHPLRVYALLELGIGAIAVAVLYGMPHIEKVYAGAAGGSWVASLALRGLLSAVVLLPPTILMGATLPAISRGLGTTPEDVSWLGFLYGANIAGAVAGCLLAGFYLLRVYDVVTATCVGAAVNLVVAAIALALSAAWPHRPMEADRPQAGPRGATGPAGVHVAIALSGLTALGAEVVWTRLLSLLLGGTVYTFSIILALFLLGLGVGSAIGSFLARSAWPHLALGYCQLLLVGAIAWAAWAISDSLPYWPLDPGISTSPWFTFQADLAACVWAVLPGAVLWGASFPLALAAAAGPAQDPGRLVAGVYAANTVGAILGALGFSMVFIPAIGTQWSQRVLLALAAMSAAVVLAPALWSRARSPGLSPARPAAAKLSAIGLAVGAALAPLLARGISPMPWAAVGYGRFCATMIPEVYPAVLDQEEIELLKRAEVWRITLRISNGAVEYESQVGGRPGEVLTAAIRSTVDAWIADHKTELLAALRKGRRLQGEGPSSAAVGGGAVRQYCTFLGEGVNVSVAVSESKDGFRYFHGAGKVQASTDPADMRLQRMLGHLSMLARSDPGSARSVLVIACGAGVTAGSFVPYESVQRIVLCEIERMVLDHVAPMFAAENNNVLGDPRTQVVVDDGRHFIRTTKETFDVITSDPLDPWVKGCAALNTREYYEMCKAHLNPGGVMTLWVPLYESDLETVRTSIATFFQVFPNGVIWSNEAEGEGYDAVLFGQVDPVGNINVDDLHDWLDRHPAVARSLEEVGFGSGRLLTGGHGEALELSVDLLATYAGQARDMAQWLRGAQINADRNLRLQYLAGMALNRLLSARLLREILAHYRFPDNRIEGSEARLAALKGTMAESGRYPPAPQPPVTR
jgi:spermidine synthase